MFRSLMVAGFSAAAVGMCLFLGISARSNSGSTLSDRANPPNVDQQQSLGRMEAELLVLRAEGFHPKEITRPAGRFLLVVQNHSTAEEISLVLTQGRAVAIREARTSRRQSKLRELVDLPPGRYVLSEVNHPDWNCTITITSN